MLKHYLSRTNNLTPEQAPFIAERLVDYNATAVAKRAGIELDAASHAIAQKRLQAALDSKQDCNDADQSENPVCP